MDSGLLKQFLNAMVEDIANSEDKRFNLKSFCENELKPNALTVFSEEEKQFLLSQTALLETIAKAVNGNIISFKKAI